MSDILREYYLEQFQKGYEEGRVEGKAEGINSLMQAFNILMKEGREADAHALMTDETRQKALFAELDIN